MDAYAIAEQVADRFFGPRIDTRAMARGKVDELVSRGLMLDAPALRAAVRRDILKFVEAGTVQYGRNHATVEPFDPKEHDGETGVPYEVLAEEAVESCPEWARDIARKIVCDFETDDEIVRAMPGNRAKNFHRVRVVRQILKDNYAR